MTRSIHSHYVEKIPLLGTGLEPDTIAPTRYRNPEQFFAWLETVRGGRNDLTISLRLSGASNKDVRAVISRSSRVFATAWRPPEIHGSAEADGTGQVLDLRADIQNLGWGSPQLWASVVGWSGRERETHSFDLGHMAPLGRFEFQERVVLKHPPDRVDLVLDCGGGASSMSSGTPANPVFSLPFASLPLYSGTGRGRHYPVAGGARAVE